MNGEGVANIMKTWLEASSIVALHPSMAAQSTEDYIGCPWFDRTSVTGDEERVIQLGRMVFVALADIASEHVDKIRTERHEPGLVELGVTNLDHCSGETYVFQGEGECLADA